MITPRLSRLLAVLLPLLLAGCPKRDGDLPQPPMEPIPAPVPTPPQGAKELLRDLTETDAARRQAAARAVFVRDAEHLSALLNRHGKNAMLQLFLAGASSRDDTTRKMAMSALGAQLSSEQPPSSDALRDLVSDLDFLLLQGESGLYMKERVEPGVFSMVSTEKCAGELLPRCLTLMMRVLDAQEQLSLQAADGGLMITANDTLVVISPEGMGASLNYTYKVNKLDRQDDKVAVMLDLSSSPRGTIEGGPVKVYADPLLLELIGAEQLMALLFQQPPAGTPTCCYYIRLVGTPSCPTCTIITRGPQGSCPNNIRTCGRATADSTLCLSKAATGATCPALTAGEIAACKQGTGCP